MTKNRSCGWSNLSSLTSESFPTTCTNNNSVSHCAAVWFDDAQSLKLKYDYVMKARGMRGLAFWTADSTQSSNLTLIAEMWSTVPTVP